jgi:hypothetical protein
MGQTLQAIFKDIQLSETAWAGIQATAEKFDLSIPAFLEQIGKGALIVLNKARRQLKALPLDIQRRVKFAIQALAEQPRPCICEGLVG